MTNGSEGGKDRYIEIQRLTGRQLQYSRREMMVSFGWRSEMDRLEKSQKIKLMGLSDRLAVHSEEEEKVKN